jgi:hypothetical protein
MRALRGSRLISDEELKLCPGDSFQTASAMTIVASCGIDRGFLGQDFPVLFLYAADKICRNEFGTTELRNLNQAGLLDAIVIGATLLGSPLNYLLATHPLADLRAGRSGHAVALAN